MQYYDVLRIDLAGAGTAFEITPATDSNNGEAFPFLVADRASAIILAVADPNLNTVVVPRAGRIFLVDPGEGDLYRDSTESRLVFIDATEGRTSVAVINDPNPGEWRLFVEGSYPPFRVDLLVLPSQLPSGGALFKRRCGFCKAMAKAIALSIVAAATLPAIPRAIIVAVASFLGVAIPIAATFISSLLGDGTNTIAEKLCRRINLC